MIADDLTGACDAGVAFAPAVVVLREGVATQADTGALIYTTNSRDETPEVAAARVSELVRRLPPHDILYKKIDSVLRGNVRAELEAMIEALGLHRTIVCPAFPEQGRTVADGVAKPAGVDLRALLDGLPVEIPNAATSADLAAIAAEAPPGTLCVGSAGLARAKGRIPPRVKVPSQGGPGRALVCVGSIHPATIAQLAEVEDEACAEVYRLEMASPDPAQLARLRKRVEGLQTGGLVLTGGDTALLVCRLLGAEGIRLEAEIEPGVPFGRLIGGLGAGLAVITKSGGFGKPETLAAAARVISAENRKDGN